MTVVRIGFTGTHKGMTEAQRASLIGYLTIKKASIGIHGGCIGADIEFDDICWNWHPRTIITVVHPSNITQFSFSLCDLLFCHLIGGLTLTPQLT